MPEIKTVHCLVYPFFDGMPPNQRLARDGSDWKGSWARQVRQIAEDPEQSSVFFIVHYPWLAPGLLDSAQRFYSWVSSKLGNRAVIVDSTKYDFSRDFGVTWDGFSRNVSGKSISFSGKVKIIAYGTHSGHCVPRQGEALLNGLRQFAPGSRFSLEEHTGLSVKYPYAHAVHMIQSARPDLYLVRDEAAAVWHAINRSGISVGDVKRALRSATSYPDIFHLVENPWLFYKQTE